MVLYLIRGLPGTGKSTLAERLAESIYDAVWYEADNFFVNPETREYKFVPELVPDAHKACQEGVYDAMMRRIPAIIVSNTFTRNREISPYFEMAEIHGYEVRVITLSLPFVSNEELVEKNVHDVPLSVIQKMRERWED